MSQVNACSVTVSVELLVRNGLLHATTMSGIDSQTLTQTFANRSPTDRTTVRSERVNERTNDR